MSQEKKYQVFISSTYTDLVEAREKATKVILDLYHLPVGMEMFSADDDDQWKIITDAIDVSDYYVLILGHRYGSLTNKGISFTEKEFNYAKSKNIPILSFIRHRDTPVSNSDRENNPKSLDKLEKFIAKASKGKMCAFWTDVSDLERQLAIALPKSFARHQGIGWVRGDSKSEHVAEEIARLSEENRKLREENDLLKKNTEVRKPELNVYLKNTIASEFSIVADFPHLPDSRKFKLPEKRLKNVVHDGLAHISRSVTARASIFGGKSPEDFFDNYNEDIDAITNTQIEAHNICMQVLHQLNTGLIELDIKVDNVGTAIATNISLEIQVPEFMMVIDNEDELDIDHYKESFSTNLIKIETPEQRSERSIRRNLPDISSLVSRQNLNFPIPAVDKNITSSVDENNTIHLTAKSLLHSKFELAKNFYLFPIEKGDGIIKIKIICVEYTQPEFYEIPITVK